ncbi:MAG: hypothetical protein IJU52_01110 [Clostridia bacterium]|nr:hypothetical protein [Clostridia bacterium]
MKDHLLKLLSCLLALLTVFGTFTAVILSAVPAYAADKDKDSSEGEEEPVEVEGFDSATFLKTSYATPEAKLRSMSVKKETGLYDQYLDPIYSYEPFKTYKDMELYVNEQSGEVAVRNKTTGQIVFTNPYDAVPNALSETGEPRTDLINNATGKLPDILSQLIITYESVKTGKSSAAAPTINSFTDAACNNQITVSHIKNGVSVEYVVGTVEERRLVPVYMEKYRFEKIILSPILEKDKAAYNKMLSYYATRMLMNGEDGNEIANSVRVDRETRYPALAQYGPEPGRTMFVSEDYNPEKAAEYEKQMQEDLLNKKAFDKKKKEETDPPYYITGFALPYTGYMSMYIYGKPATREKIQIESYIRNYVPNYSFEDLEYDHKLTGYVETGSVSPAFRAALEYTLKDGGFTVRMPANSLIFDEDNFRLRSVTVLPYLGAGSYDNKGYVFLPDGSGSLIRFEDYIGQAVVFNTGTMYGPDNAYHTLPAGYTGHEEKMRAPIYGIVETVNLDFSENADGTLTENCRHVWTKKTITADCSRKIDGGTAMYCKDCGAVRYLESKPYSHGAPTSSKVIQTADCHHIGIVEEKCPVCQQLYDELSKKFTDAQIEECYGDLRWHTVETGYGAHTYNDLHYVEIDGQCYEYYLCSRTYELTDENGNIVYERDEKGELKLDKKNDPIPVLVQCGEMLKGENGVPANGLLPVDHEFDEATELTYVKDGHCVIEHTCLNCGYREVLTDVHRFGEESYPVHEDGVCAEKKICTVCGLAVNEPVEHTYADDAEYVAEKGFCKETRTCLLCGHKEVTLLTHEPEEVGDEILTKDHRCYVEVRCARCGTDYEIDVEHEYDENGACKRCGFSFPEEEGHEYEEAYIADGDICWRTFRCADCGKEYGGGSARVKTAHVYGERLDDGKTCLETLHTWYQCEKCGYRSGEADTVNEERTEHDYRLTLPEDLVCTDGYDAKTVCAICGDVSGSTHVVGHIYGEAAAVIDGITKSVCTVCGHEHYSETAPETPGTEETPDVGETPETPEEKTESAKVTKGFFAMMTEGSTLTSLVAATGGVETKYCRAYMVVNPRPRDTYNLRDAISTGADAEWTVVSKRKYTGNYTLEMTMMQSVEGEAAKKAGYVSTPYAADYSGMAAIYRDYLRAGGVLSDLKKASGVPLYIEAFGAISVASSFLTFPTTEMKPLNTFEDLKNIVGELNEEGIDTSVMNIRLRGFANGGMTPTMPYKVSFESAVGGDDGYKDFLEYASEKKIGVYPDFDFAYMHRNKAFDGYTDSDHAVETIDGRYIVKKEYDPTLQIFTPTGLLAVSTSVYGYFCDAFVKNYGKFNNLGVSVASLGTDLNSDFDKEDPYNREDSRIFTAELLSKLKEAFGSVMIDGGNDYAVGYADHIMNLSMTGSTYQMTSCSVPFFSMVFHGSVNYAGGATNMASSMDQEILHILENGAAPHFILASRNTKYLKESTTMSKYYSLDYSTWKEDMIDIYKEINAVLGDVVNAKFVQHDFVSGVRVPDKDESAEDQQKIIATVRELIGSYKKAETRKENADALFERKFSGLLAGYEDELKSIIASYGWSKDDAALESADVVLSDADKARVGELLKLISDLQKSKSGDLYVALSLDKQKADAAYEAAKEAFERAIAHYEIYFDVPRDKRLDPDAYNVDSYRGVIYEENGELKLATDGAFDVDGNPVGSTYDLADDSIVRVTYDNGVVIYINYNYYDVVVKDQGQNVRISAYGYYKTAKGED